MTRSSDRRAAALAAIVIGAIAGAIAGVRRRYLGERSRGCGTSRVAARARRPVHGRGPARARGRPRGHLRAAPQREGECQDDPRRPPRYARKGVPRARRSRVEPSGGPIPRDAPTRVGGRLARRAAGGVGGTAIEPWQAASTARRDAAAISRGQTRRTGRRSTSTASCESRRRGSFAAARPRGSPRRPAPRRAASPQSTSIRRSTTRPTRSSGRASSRFARRPVPARSEARIARGFTIASGTSDEPCDAAPFILYDGRSAGRASRPRRHRLRERFLPAFIAKSTMNHGFSFSFRRRNGSASSAHKRETDAYVTVERVKGYESLVKQAIEAREARVQALGAPAGEGEAERSAVDEVLRWRAVAGADGRGNALAGTSRAGSAPRAGATGAATRVRLEP